MFECIKFSSQPCPVDFSANHAKTSAPVVAGIVALVVGAIFLSPLFQNPTQSLYFGLGIAFEALSIGLMIAGLCLHCAAKRNKREKLDTRPQMSTPSSASQSATNDDSQHKKSVTTFPVEPSPVVVSTATTTTTTSMTTPSTTLTTTMVVSASDSERKEFAQTDEETQQESLSQEKQIQGELVGTRFEAPFDRIPHRKELRLEAGSHKITLLHGDKQVHDLTTKGSIYFYPDVQLDEMTNPGCLVMLEEDFWVIKQMIHPGAFGGDYISLNQSTPIWTAEYVNLDNGLIAVWKMPADLKEIEGWISPLEIRQERVGVYLMVDDTADGYIMDNSAIPLPDNCTNNIRAEKIRQDLPLQNGMKPPSVHHLVPQLRGAGIIPAFSTGNLFMNFNRPKPDEKAKAAQLLVDLNALGIKAFMCNGNHHLVVLYKNAEEDLLTPEDVANMLQEPEKGQAIINAFQQAGKSDFNAVEWAQSFVLCYGSKP